MTKRGKISIVVLLSITVVTACLFIPYGKMHPDEAVSYYVEDVWRLRVESPMIYDDFRDMYIFSSKYIDSALVHNPDFMSREDVFKLPSYFDYLKADDTVSFNDSFALYKLREDKDVFSVSLSSKSTEITGDSQILGKTGFRYSSGFYVVNIGKDDNRGRKRICIKNLSASREMPETIDTRRKIIYGHPLLYIPYPLGRSTPYIFSDRILSTFDFDTRFCGKRNYYAMMYRTELPVEQLCRVLCYDGNGVLAEIREEYNAVKYPLYLTKTILPSGRWDKTYKAYVKSPKSLLLKSRFIGKTEPDSVWAGIRELSDRIDTVPQDYDPAIFVNACDLIASQKRK